MSETFVSYAALGLTLSGWSVHVIPLNSHARAHPEAHAVNEELSSAIRLIRLDPTHGLRSLIGRHGLRGLRAIDPTRLAREAFTGRSMHLANALGRGGPYDIIHCQFSTLAAPVLALRRAGIIDARIVVHFRGNDISTFVQQHGPWAHDITFNEADWFIANCRYFRDRAIELGCDLARIDVVPSGCDVSRFPFQERAAPEAGPIRLLAVGRLVEKKGHDLAIEALRLLRARGRDVALRIVGDGPLAGALAAQAAAAGVSDRIVFVGERSHDGVAEELGRAHVFLAPSRRAADGDEDGPVNTLKEAMATGAPVVAARHGGIPELVEHGVSGLIAAENDAADLAARIDQMIDAAPHWAAFGRAGRSAVETRFSLDCATRALESVYARTLSQPDHIH